MHWRRGKAGSERVGRTVAHHLGWDINGKKNREMGGPFALDGRPLMEGHNNQPKVGINYGSGIEEERRPGRNVWGVLSLCLERRINEEKQQQRKCIVALDGRQRMKITQQPTKKHPARRRR